MVCALCDRDAFVDQHHLIPKSRWKRVCKVTTYDQRRETVDLCISCHAHVHNTFTVTELARKYNTVEKLAEEEEIQKFVVWIRTKPANFVAPRRKLKKVH